MHVTMLNFFMKVLGNLNSGPHEEHIGALLLVLLLFKIGHDDLTIITAELLLAILYLYCFSCAMYSQP